MSGKLVIAADDLWLLRLFVLVRLKRSRFRKRASLRNSNRRKIGGVSGIRVRRLLRALAGKKLIRPIAGKEAVFVATSGGRKAALEAGAQISLLPGLFNTGPSRRAPSELESHD